MANSRCKWVHDRLPLLAGEELLIADRRRVERHLIGCSTCQQRRIAIEQALKVLHASAVHSPTQADASSLWPELARQIRQSRRPVSTSLWSWSWSRFEFWPAVGFCASFTLVVIIGLIGNARNHQVANAQVQSPLSTQPIVAAPVIVTEASTVTNSEPSDETSKPQADPTPLPETVATTRLGYDLDHGTPMGPEPAPTTTTREKKQPTY